MLSLPLTHPVTQEQFGDLVGVSQPVVSDLLARGILLAGQPAATWLRAYTKHLREQAAGRGADGELARERARLAREQADRVAMDNAVNRRELAPVSVLELVLAKMAGDVGSLLQGLVPRVRRRVDLPGEALRILDEEVTKARNRAAAMTLADAEEEPEEEDEA
ncbi:terminase small subunit [Rhizobacter sp. SG703]|uniref:terminase small subunit n=1 Tax=Rhizobacter sp. SG703 TaxID=2587140 RepID=UPI001448096F|nr:terminase small subunit [Rhizobacter sp. SG703]NKI94727.1 phage terminase Nu1 subunit (DNA packaging protein) [Rhizobacter sp. SG703]